MILQEFSGIVTELLQDSVIATLVDLTNPLRPDESCEINLRVFDEADRELLVPGCGFFWSIGFEFANGGLNHFSEIKVTRTLKWTEEEIAEIKKEGAELFKKFR